MASGAVGCDRVLSNVIVSSVVLRASVRGGCAGSVTRLTLCDHSPNMFGVNRSQTDAVKRVSILL